MEGRPVAEEAKDFVLASSWAVVSWSGRLCFFFSSRRRHTRLVSDWSSDVCSSDLVPNLSLDDWEVTVSHVDYAPGRVGTPHKHAGFVLAYVLEGNVVAKISGQGEETDRKSVV